MRRPDAPWVVLLAGCVSAGDSPLGKGGVAWGDRLLTLEPAWEEAADACGVPEEPWYESGLMVNDPDPVLSSACIAVLDRHLGLEEDSFFDGGDGAGAWTLDDVRFGMWFLFSQDIGTVSELRESAFGLVREDDARFIREPFVVEMERTSQWLGEPDLRVVLYDIVAASIKTTDYVGDESGTIKASAVLATGAVHWTNASVTITTAEMTIHEAIHIWLQVGHVPCDGYPEDSCDDDFSGTYGYAAAWDQNLLRRLPLTLSPVLYDATEFELSYLLSSSVFGINEFLEQYGQDG